MLQCYNYNFYNCFSCNNSKNHLWYRMGHTVIFNRFSGNPSVRLYTCAADGTYGTDGTVLWAQLLTLLAGPEHARRGTI